MNLEPKDSLDSVVMDGLYFCQSLTDHFGAEKGMEIWEKIGEAVGKDIKGRIFFALITGKIKGKIRFQSSQCNDAVGVIKAIRTATGYGLKEAKDLYDYGKANVAVIEIKDAAKAKVLEYDLRQYGCRLY